MERTVYNLLTEGRSAGSIATLLRERYGITNARWIQSAVNQAEAVMMSQEEGIEYRIELYKEKIRNTREKMKHLSSLLKMQGCEAKIRKLEAQLAEMKKQLDERSYPRAAFGSIKTLHQLSIAIGERKENLKVKWRERRSGHFFSVGQANQRGNGNTRLVYKLAADRFYLEIRNWYVDDFMVPVRVPLVYREVLRQVIRKAESVKLGRHGEVLKGGLAYSIRVIRSNRGYQILVSFELEENQLAWTGRLAGIDINPEGIACTVASSDGNLVATRFFRDSRLVFASACKKKWVLENLINRMLRWCKQTLGCNVVALETIKMKGAYDYDPSTNFKLSNFARAKMIDVIKLHALEMDMLSVEVNPAYSSMVAVAKYGRQFGGFNKHQLAAFVIARRALGYGEAPAFSSLPRTRRERIMWNHCIRYYGYSPLLRTLPQHEPMEWKSGEDGNGEGRITELLKAPPAITSSLGLGHAERTIPSKLAIGRAGRAHPNRHANGGDGARGHRVNPPSEDVSGYLQRYGR